MTDRIFALTVILEKDIRADDVEALTNAISMFRGVLEVTKHVASPEAYTARVRARQELGEKLWAVLYPPSEKE